MAAKPRLGRRGGGGEGGFALPAPLPENNKAGTMCLFQKPLNRKSTLLKTECLSLIISK